MFKPSSIYNPVSNAFVESCVRLNKLLQVKTACSDMQLQDFMLWSNCLMRPDNTGSPAELFFRRNMKTCGLPRSTIREVDFERIQMFRQELVALRKNRDTSKHYKCHFKISDKVVIQDSQSRQWNERGSIVAEKPCVEPGSSRSYLINVGGARIKLRNILFIRLSCSTVQPVEQISWHETSPVGKEQLLESRKHPGKRSVRFCDVGW